MRPTIKDTCDCCNGTTTILLTTYEACDVIVKCELCDGTGWIDREMTDTEAIDFILKKLNEKPEPPAPEPPGDYRANARVVFMDADNSWCIGKPDGSSVKRFENILQVAGHLVDVARGASQ